jgi:hypothetical protein
LVIALPDRQLWHNCWERALLTFTNLQIEG